MLHRVCSSALLLSSTHSGEQPHPLGLVVVGVFREAQRIEESAARIVDVTCVMVPCKTHSRQKR